MDDPYCKILHYPYLPPLYLILMLMLQVRCIRTVTLSGVLWRSMVAFFRSKILPFPDQTKIAPKTYQILDRWCL